MLERRLALGGMAEIWAATDGPRPVALKILEPRLAEEPDFRAMFADELRTAKNLRHRHIVQVEGVHHDGPILAMSMERIDGTDLRRLLRHLAKGGRWSPIPIALAIGKAVAEALDYVHTASDESGHPLGIIHRDISPHNVMVGRDGVTRILDFGIARAAERFTRTRSGVVKGKAGYMAPE